MVLFFLDRMFMKAFNVLSLIREPKASYRCALCYEFYDAISVEIK